jgi:hypothetical protein
MFGREVDDLFDPAVVTATATRSDPAPQHKTAAPAQTWSTVARHQFPASYTVLSPTIVCKGLMSLICASGTVR